MRRSLPPVLVLSLLLLPGLAGAATVVAVDGPHEETRRPAAGEAVDLPYTLRSIRSDTVDWFVDVDPPDGWTATPRPANGTLDPQDSLLVQVELEPGPDATSGTARTTFTVFDRNASQHERVTRTVTLEPQTPPLVLGTFDNPLPPPADGVWGAAVLNLLAWAAIVVGAFLAVDPVLARVAGAPRTADRITRLVRFPLAGFLALWGLVQTTRTLPPSRPVVLTGNVLDIVRLLVGVWLGFRVFRSLIIYYRQRVAPYTQYELDDMVIPLIEKVGAAFFVAAAFLLLLSNLGVDVGVLLAAGGFASIIIGFAAQNTLSNFFSGINILLDRPFREGDDVQLETGEVCRVEHIGLRTTRLYHYRQHEIIIVPNNDLATKRVVNLIYPDKRYRWNVDVGVAYGTDVGLVKEILYQAADEHPEVISDPDFEPMVFFDGFGDSSLQFTLRFFITDVRERWRIAGDIRQRIDDLFDEHDVTIPFPQRTHWFPSSLRLGEGSTPPGPGTPMPRDEPSEADGSREPTPPDEPTREGARSDPDPEDDPGSAA